jgi:CBS domain-containing protein
MAEFTEVELLRIYCGESDRIDGRPAHEVLVEIARRHGAAGATVLRGVLGFGAGSLVHTAKLLRLSEDLPMVVEIVDRPERIEALLPRIEAAAKGGCITRQSLRAHFHCPVRVHEVMAADVATVKLNTPLPEVVDLLLARGVKAVPVLDADGRVAGIITGGDLLTRGGLDARLSLQQSLPEEARREERGKLSGRTAADVMTAPVATIDQKAGLREAARLMIKKGLKRLPAVDEAGELVGIVSRADILRSAASLAPAAQALPRFTAGLFQLARDVMFSDVPTAAPDAPLSEIVAKILASPLRRVVVTDASGKVLGIVVDGDLLSRCGPGRKKGILQALFGLGGDEGEAACPSGTAAEVMERNVNTVPEDAALMDVLQKMLSCRCKRLVVVDDDFRLLGMVDRDAVLRVIAGI